MNIQEIFYRTQRVQYYVLSTCTIKGENKKAHTIYAVEWHTLKGTLKDEVTKEEYDILLKGLENE